MSRASRVGSETVPEVKPGDLDTMSRMRRRLHLPACTTSNRCTRPAGHDESEGHPAGQHVRTCPEDTVQEVWS